MIAFLLYLATIPVAKWMIGGYAASCSAIPRTRCRGSGRSAELAALLPHREGA